MEECLRSLGNINAPKFTEKEAELFQGQPTLSECFEALKIMRNNVTPGNYGL